MIKKIILPLSILLMFLTGCNKQLVDTAWNFKYADIEGVGTVEIASWNDFEGSDMIQIKTKDGINYLTHSSNIVLRSK